LNEQFQCFSHSQSEHWMLHCVSEAAKSCNRRALIAILDCHGPRWLDDPWYR
jgi:hypothetical protein